MTPQNRIPFRMSDCTSLRQLVLYQCTRNCTVLRKIEPVQNHIKPELQHTIVLKWYHDDCFLNQATVMAVDCTGQNAVLAA